MSVLNEEAMPGAKATDIGQPSIWPSLWQNRNFRLMWGGQSISAIGSEVTAFAVPLIAAATLGSTPTEMSVLLAVPSAAWLLFGLLAGAYADRWPRKQIMIAMDLIRAISLAIIPVAALSGWLNLPLLVVIAFATSAASVFGVVASQSLLPTLLPTEQIPGGNAALETSRSVGRVFSPGLAGIIAATVGPALAVIIDAISFIISAISLSGVKVKGTAPRAAPNGGVREEIAEGISYVFRHEVLRPLAIAVGAFNLANSLAVAVFALYVLRELGLPPALFGVMAGVGSIGLLPGSILASRTASWIGVGRAVAVGGMLAGLGEVLVGSAGGTTFMAGLVLAAALFGQTIASAIGNVNALSLRQMISVPEVLGRVNATFRLLSWGLPLIGTVAGGILAERIGLRATILISGVGQMAAMSWLLLSKGCGQYLEQSSLGRR